MRIYAKRCACGNSMVIRCRQPIGDAALRFTTNDNVGRILQGVNISRFRTSVVEQRIIVRAFTCHCSECEAIHYVSSFEDATRSTH